MITDDPFYQLDRVTDLADGVTSGNSLGGNEALSLVDGYRAESGGQSNGGLPVGAAGAMLYSNGAVWVALPPPTISVANPVLRHNGTNPYWEEPEGCA